jgi:hypothetical protein
MSHAPCSHRNEPRIQEGEQSHYTAIFLAASPALISQYFAPPPSHINPRKSLKTEILWKGYQKKLKINRADSISLKPSAGLAALTPIHASFWGVN